MYDKLFNQELQNQMTNYFTHHLSVLGRIKAFEKNEIIDPEDADHIYIVLDGDLNQILYSEDGKEIIFYRLERGNVFGEMDFFDGFRTCVVTKAMSACAISIVSRDIVEQEMAKQPDIYKHFIHSIVRKYRIVMLEFSDTRFNDSLGKIAHLLLRLSHTTAKDGIKQEDNNIINLSFTHEELASRINANRSTITNGLNKLKDMEVITLDGKQISIINYEKLRKCINHYIPE